MMTTRDGIIVEVAEHTVATTGIDNPVGKGEAPGLGLGLRAVGILPAEGSKQFSSPDQQVKCPPAGAANLKCAWSNGETLVLHGSHSSLG